MKITTQSKTRMFSQNAMKLLRLTNPYSSENKI